MSESIVYTVSVAVPNGPTLGLHQSLTVDAFDKIAVTVPDQTTSMTVELQPGGTNQVHFLLVTADQYLAGLAYKVNTATASNNLDGPLVLIGPGAVGLLNTAPAKLVFSNSTGQDVKIEILIGRDATP